MSDAVNVRLMVNDIIEKFEEIMTIKDGQIERLKNGEDIDDEEEKLIDDCISLINRITYYFK